MTLFLHEVHRVRGLCEDDFEAHYRDRWMRALCEGPNADEARLLWYAHQAHGSGPAYRIVTVTAVADGAAYQRLLERVAAGDLRTGRASSTVCSTTASASCWSRCRGRRCRRSISRRVPVEPADHELTLYMEDTGWPHAPLDDYTAFWGEVYAPMLERSELLRIEACFQTAHGAGRRPEAILLQKVISHDGLLRLLETETRAELKQPGTFMHDALQVRDQWESRLLRTSAWSPLF